jgi:precorrin-8X/cobalt-precorrin-8 methylmutase
MSIKTGVVVLAHGSKVKSGNEGLFKIVEMLRAMGKWDMVEAGFLQLAKPGLTEAVEDIVGKEQRGWWLCRFYCLAEIMF